MCAGTFTCGRGVQRLLQMPFERTSIVPPLSCTTHGIFPRGLTPLQPCSVVWLKKRASESCHTSPPPPPICSLLIPSARAAADPLLVILSLLRTKSLCSRQRGLLWLLCCLHHTVKSDISDDSKCPPLHCPLPSHPSTLQWHSLTLPCLYSSSTLLQILLEFHNRVIQGMDACPFLFATLFLSNHPFHPRHHTCALKLFSICGLDCTLNSNTCFSRFLFASRRDAAVAFPIAGKWWRWQGMQRHILVLLSRVAVS